MRDRFCSPGSLLTGVLLPCLVLLAADRAQAAPPNDDFQNATVITALPFTDTVDTSGATRQGADSCTSSGSVWYKFTPAAAMRVEATTIGSLSPDFLGVSIGTPLGPSVPPSPLGLCDGPLGGGCGSIGPRIVLELTAGDTYYFEASASPVPGGSPILVFSLRVAPPAPANDDVDQATVISELPFTDSVNTISATFTFSDDSQYCGSGAASVWYRFTPAEDTIVTPSTIGSDYPAGVTIFSEAPGGLPAHCLFCGGPFNSAELTGGVTYLIMVSAIDDFGFNAGGNLLFGMDGGPPPREAIKVFGQPGFLTGTPNRGGLSASSLSNPQGVAVDPSGEHLYVADRANHRILEYEDPATGDAVADHVFGQSSDFSSGTENLGGISASSLNSPFGLGLDPDGNLYVADGNNNRVLRYDDPLGTDDVADLSLGQPDFMTGTQNTGGRSAFSLAVPHLGVAVDADRNLYVSEFSNTRVVRYDAPLLSFDGADLVLGEPDFSTLSPLLGPSATSLGAATGLALDRIGNLFVADLPYARVLQYSPPLTTNQPPADLVIGAPDFNTFTEGACAGARVPETPLCEPRGLAVDCAGNLYVADGRNNRVLVYHDPLTTDTVADEVLGQFNFRNVTPLWDGGRSARTLQAPRGLAVDGQGRLYVADSLNHRVLMFAMFEGLDVDSDGLYYPEDACACEAPLLGLDADTNGCTDTLAGLRAIVEGLAVASNSKNGLLRKLDEAQKALNRGTTSVAIMKLHDFIDQVEGKRGQEISNPDADLLVAYANNLIALLQQ